MIAVIGKSSAFASLVHHLNRKETAHIMKEAFPFFKKFDNYIFIEA